MPQVNMKLSDAMELIIRSLELDKPDNALEIAISLRDQLLIREAAEVETKGGTEESKQS